MTIEELKVYIQQRIEELEEEVEILENSGAGPLLLVKYSAKLSEINKIWDKLNE